MDDISKKKIKYLENIAKQIRKDIIEMFRIVKKGHIGGSLSIVEILVALYFHIIKVYPDNPKQADRDRIVLSKGHASAALYATLARKGFFSRDLLFSQFVKIDGLLQEHCEMRKIPGVEMSTGALGQGLSVALGMSLASRLTRKEYKTFVIIGDGEMQSGQVWEALMACSHFKVKNLIAIIDYNKLQVCGLIENIMDIEPLVEKLKAFKWKVFEVDGNDLTKLVSVLKKAKNYSLGPVAIICHTTKGKGISFMENKIEWHSNVLTENLYQKAIEELTINHINEKYH